jgi:hypothetical protein
MIMTVKAMTILMAFVRVLDVLKSHGSGALVQGNKGT